MIINKIIDLKNDWNAEKIMLFGDYLAREYGPVENCKLYIDCKSYNDLQMDWNALARYYDTFRPENTQLMMYVPAGQVFIYPTSGVDYIEFMANNNSYHFKISNKIKEYRSDFDKLIEE